MLEEARVESYSKERKVVEKHRFNVRRG